MRSHVSHVPAIRARRLRPTAPGCSGSCPPLSHPTHPHTTRLRCRGDEEADDNSKAAADLASRHFLATLPACPALEALRLLGPCAASPKFMPVLQQGGSEALAWLWSVVRERGLHHQFGLSGREMRERQQLFGDSLRIGHGSAAQPRAGVAGAAAPGAGQPWCCIEVVRDGREAAGPE